jgi:hypothetical protein
VGSNSAGTAFGSDMTFTTSACPVTPPAVATGSATVITATGATLNGTVNPHGATTTAYFQWGTTASYGSSTAPQNVGSGTSASGVSAILTGLSPITTYHYRIVATNSAGTTYGSDMTFTTSSSGGGIVKKVSDGTTYSTIQGAYGQCSSGDILEIQATTFNESPDFNRANVSVFLKGGYDSGFVSQVGMTAVQGTLTISAGTITVENLIIDWEGWHWDFSLKVFQAWMKKNIKLCFSKFQPSSIGHNYGEWLAWNQRGSVHCLKVLLQDKFQTQLRNSRR